MFMEKIDNNFRIGEIARSYVFKRFPFASKKEKEKIKKDWERKVEVSRMVANDFKRRTGDIKGIKILDDGCGNGGLAIAFAEAGAEVFGVDIEKELIDIAQKHSAIYKVFPKFIFYNGKKLPFEDNFFDAVLSISVLEHVSNPVNYLSEISRVLKFGGYLYLAFPNRLWPRETHTLLWGITYLPYKIAEVITRLFKRNPLSENNLHFYTYWNLKKMLIESGKWSIKEEKGESVGFFKKFIKSVLNLLGIPYKTFLPHISVILQKQI